MSEKEYTLALLRGGTCRRCKYVIRESRYDNLNPEYRKMARYHEREQDQTLYTFVDLDTPHCALRTDSNGKLTQKSETRFELSCKNFWRR